jgi:hypothetical protein
MSLKTKKKNAETTANTRQKEKKRKNGDKAGSTKRW